ncbi:putative vacuolar protein sorting-associated protein TDA6 [Escovopsis weberi]|uniref:Putative vacuolar protein sorting-associated protein TDA6 n=1 Tax=Escovopsis weberi TaxID=150374 RepID=A0A0M8MXT5_ESCWE|nr:putative vacuolar protein sorting-associated protein TDA6 [Escovopsis weberi]
MFWLRRGCFALVVLLAFVFLATYLPSYLDPTNRPEKRARDRRWVSSSPYFWDRQCCRWLSLCGLHHLRKDPALRGDDLYDDDDDDDDDDRDELRLELRRRSWEDDGKSEEELASIWSQRTGTGKKRDPNRRRRILKDIPDYVIKHAPLVHLYSGEQFWPSDIREHVTHMGVTLDGRPLDLAQNISLHNLQQLNKYDNGWLTMHSNENVETRPKWLHSNSNLPNPFEDDDSTHTPPASQGERSSEHRETNTWFDVDKDHPLHNIADPRLRKKPSGHPSLNPGKHLRYRRGHKPNEDGYSDAPAILIVVDKGSGIVDAFWFFFYSYNLGQTVLGLRFGNHVGDWEHSMIRFENGVPRGIFFSEHEGGQAYAWQAVEKRGERPVIYSAVGSHAMYALPGHHPYILPFKLLKDVTDKGPIWDPSLNNYAYHYDYTREREEDVAEQEVLTDVGLLDDTHSLTPAAKNPDAPTSWFHYRGRWGDEVYTLADRRQWRLFGQYHYVTGPSGPKFKHLERAKMCQTISCKILYEIDPHGTWY